MPGIKGNWYLSDQNKNCQDTCQALNMDCSEEEFNLHNEDIDTSEEVINLIRTLGGTISLPYCCSDYGTSAGVPNFSSSHNACFFSDQARPLSSFDFQKNACPPNEN